MAKSRCGSVDEYIAAQGEDVQAVLRSVRRAIRAALLEADEVISYDMPAYKLGGEVVIYFAAWKKHYAIYPAGAALVAKFKDELGSCDVGKGTLRFAFSGQVPVGLIGRIAKYRAREVVDSKRTKHG